MMHFNTIKDNTAIRTDWCLHFQLSSLITELASAAASEKEIAFEEAMEERLCAYSRAVAHFPTAVKEVNDTRGVFAAHPLSQSF